MRERNLQLQKVLHGFIFLGKSLPITNECHSSGLICCYALLFDSTFQANQAFSTTPGEGGAPKVLNHSGKVALSTHSQSIENPALPKAQQAKKTGKYIVPYKALLVHIYQNECLQSLKINGSFSKYNCICVRKPTCPMLTGNEVNGCSARSKSRACQSKKRKHSSDNGGSVQKSKW